MVVKANIVKNQKISVDLNQKAGGFNAPVQSVNGKTGDVVLVATDVGALPDTTSIPSKVSELENDNGYLTSYTETDPTVPAWAKEPTKPTYTADEVGARPDTWTPSASDVGADPEGTAETKVSEHNTNTEAHNDIRILIEGLTTRLNTLADSDDITLDQMSELVAYIKANRGLIEGVTTNKVNVSDIINNLTTNVSNKPLSAAQGVALKSLIDTLSDWTHQAVDELVDAVIEPNKAESAFNLVSSDTLSWNGDTTGKVAVYSADKILYVHVSSIVPTAEDLQAGGMCAWIGSEDCPFVSGDIVETDDYIIPEQYDSVVIAKKDNATYNTLVFPTQGIYFAYDTSERRVESLTINGYTGFVEPILKMENMTPHDHDWYGKPINKGNTLRSDDIVHGGFVKVSDAVPTLAEVQKGGTLRYYYVNDNKISGDLVVANYLESPYSVVSPSGQIWIASDGIPMVQIKSDGTYFRQSEDSCVHSLTINEYTGFSYNLEKVPAELLPENTGGGVSSWNDLTDKPFGETTVTKDAITWDGNTDGLYNVTGLFYHVSEAIPTLEDLQQGGSLVFGGIEMPFTNSNVLDVSVVGMGNDAILILNGSDPLAGVVLKAGATVTMQGFTVTFERAGIYFMNSTAYGAYTSSLTINNYEFVENKIKTLDPKYLPSADTDTDIIFTTNGTDVFCNKTYEDVWAMEVKELLNAFVIGTVDSTTDFADKAVDVRKTILDDRTIVIFSFVGGRTGAYSNYSIAMNSLGEIGTMN